MNILKILGLKKERFLGISTGKRCYDLPLDSNAGNKFIKMLVCLMTILLLLSFAGAFALSSIAQNWSSGLEGKASVEIPAVDENGALLDKEKISRQTILVSEALKDISLIREITVLKESDIIELVKPWLGDTIDTSTTPLPGIIAIEFHQHAEIDYGVIENRIQSIAPQARLDTHDSWLSDILKLTNSLRFAAFIIISVIGLTTIVAIAGAVRTRLSAYKEDLELLHLMGAGDNYISGQFQKHTMILAFQGSLIGMIIGLILLFLINILLASKGVTLLPNFSLTVNQKIFMIAIPFILAALSMLTARFTVLRTLAQMP